MTYLADLDSAPLTIALDPRNPFCYLALEPAIAFGHSEDVEINWLPTTTPALRAPSLPREVDDRSIRHKRNRAHAIAREIATYADAQGLEIRDPYREPDPSNAQLAWLWVRDRNPAHLPDFLRILFRRYWSADLDPTDLAAIAALVEEFGGDGAEFESWATEDGVSVVTALAESLREVGLFQAPAYLIEDEVFYGRQHLPMIRWILHGRKGRVPI